MPSQHYFAHTQCEAVHTVGALIIGIFNIVYFHARNTLFHHLADGVRLMAYTIEHFTAVLRQGSQCILENFSFCKALRLRQGERLKALAFARKNLLGWLMSFRSVGSCPGRLSSRQMPERPARLVACTHHKVW